MDIDIDIKPSLNIKTIFPQVVIGSLIKDNNLVKHPCGVYFQNMPVDDVTGLAAIPYEHATAAGFFKVDFLNVSLLESFNSKQEIRDLIKKEPDWELLTDEAVVRQLFQIHNQFEIVNKIKPTTVQELADTIAILRPNKRNLLHKYLNNRNAIRPLLYRLSNDDKSSFKRGHAIAYALTIVLQLHQIKEQCIF